MVIRFLSAFMLIVLVAACAPQSAPSRDGAFEPYQQKSVEPASQGEVMNTRPTRVSPTANQTQMRGEPYNIALLLPLSGQHKAIGEDLFNAAQMALFDMNDPNITLLPLDTKGTVSGARDAVNQAVAQNAKLILGPLLAQNVAQAGQSARAHNLNVIGFTTDRSRIGGNVFTLGILPYDQGQRLAKYAAKRNLNRIVILTPDNPYAREVTQAFRDMTAKSSLSVVETITVDSRDGLNEAELNRLASLSGDFDGLLMPFGNPYLNAAAEDLNRVGLNAQTTAWLGTGIWDEPTILRNAAMRGAFYAAPSADQRKRFERKYQSIYGERPERLASLGYDAVALSVVLMRQTGGEINRAALLNPNGFMGTDGAFRFRADGITERSLAIQRIEGMGRVRPVDAAPTRF